jgi:tetratricopeptide (TPR) repeat protein
VPGVRLASSALVALALAAAAWAAYSTSFPGVFVFDDKFAIADNPNIKTLWPLTRSMSAPPELPMSGRPIASLTLAINYALAPADARDVMAPGNAAAPPGTTELFLRNVWGYHFMNLALHVLAALALFGVVRRTLLSDRLRPRLGGASTALAFVVALVWLVHPLPTDAVTYVTQRTEVLMGLFYLLTLYCAIRAARARAVERWWWTAGAIVACALGMGSKQTMVTAPFIVFLWDWVFGPSGRGKLGPYDEVAGSASSPPRLRWRLYAGLGATWVILVALVAMERWPHSIGFDREGWTPWTYLLTQTGVILHYLRLSLLPAPLVLDYDGWPMARSVLDVAPQAALLAVLAGATLFALVRRQPWGFVGAWFFALLVPSSSFLPLASEIAAERRMYVALASIVVVAVIGAYLIGRGLLDRLVADARARRTVGTVTAMVLVGGLIVTLAAQTNARNRDYWSEERLWQDTVEKRPDNPRARLNYGVELSLARRYAEAELQLREAIRLKETSAPAHGNLGSVLCSLGRLDEGVSHLERAVALDPEYRPAYGNLGEAYGALGRRGLAAKYFALAVDRESDNPFLLNRLGWLLATSPEDAVRNGAKAVEVSERAVRLTSRHDTISLDTLAASYAELGRFTEAAAIAGQTLALAQSRGQSDLLPQLQYRLDLYRAGQRFREPLR